MHKRARAVLTLRLAAVVVALVLAAVSTWVWTFVAVGGAVAVALLDLPKLFGDEERTLAERFDLPQRVVLVVGLGVVAVALASLADRVLGFDDGGWFAYAPETAVVFEGSRSDWPVVRSALVWVVAAACWTSVALPLVRLRPAPRPSSPA